MRAQIQVCFNLEQDMNNWWIALLRHVSGSLTDSQIKLMEITLSVARKGVTAPFKFDSPQIIFGIWIPLEKIIYGLLKENNTCERGSLV